MSGPKSSFFLLQSIKGCLVFKGPYINLSHMVLLTSSVWEELIYLAPFSFWGYRHCEPCWAFTWMVGIQTQWFKLAEQTLLPTEPFYTIRASCQLCIYMQIARSFWKKNEGILDIIVWNLKNYKWFFIKVWRILGQPRRKGISVVIVTETLPGRIHKLLCWVIL